MLTQGEAGSDALARPKHQLTPERKLGERDWRCCGGDCRAGGRLLGRAVVGRQAARPRSSRRVGGRAARRAAASAARATRSRDTNACLARAACPASLAALAREAGLLGARLGTSNAGVCAAARARLPRIFPPPSAPSPTVAMRLFVLLPLLLLFASLVAAAQWSKEDVEVRRRGLHARHSHD